MSARHNKGAGIFKTLGAQFPAWGMIGTLIGLIQLLKALDDPSAIGPAMAVAWLLLLWERSCKLYMQPHCKQTALKSREEIQEKR